MGLSASQVRLLSLTSRQHAIEGEAQRLQNYKMRLANDSDRAYRVYLNALNDTSLKTLQTNRETGDSCWINGSINNLIRYQTSDTTTGKVFYVQDLETGKLHIPKELGNKFDIATDARNFAEQFGITYKEVDHNEDLKIHYNEAIKNGWNNIISAADYELYLAAVNKDTNIKASANLILNFIPSTVDGIYEPFANQNSLGSNYIHNVQDIIGSEYFNTVYTANERAVITQSVNLYNSMNPYPTDTSSEGSDDTGSYTKYVDYLDKAVKVTKNGKEYVSTGSSLSANDRYLIMLNGGTYQTTAKKKETIIYDTDATTSTTESNYDSGSIDVYDSTTTSILNAYGGSSMTSMGDALKQIFTRVSTENHFEDDFLNNHGLTKEQINNYKQFLNYEIAYESYTPDIEFVPDDTIKGPYYEQVYKAIEFAGGWIEANDTRAQNDTWVQNMIKNAQVILTTWDDKTEALSKTSAALNTNIKEVTDNSRVEKASQDYDAEMDLINSKDTSYDTILQKLESERTALTTEIDSIETVMKDNVDKHFKLYS